jgi:hypothetical protein
MNATSRSSFAVAAVGSVAVWSLLDGYLAFLLLFYGSALGFGLGISILIEWWNKRQAVIILNIPPYPRQEKEYELPLAA